MDCGHGLWDLSRIPCREPARLTQCSQMRPGSISTPHQVHVVAREAQSLFSSKAHVSGVRGDETHSQWQFPCHSSRSRGLWCLLPGSPALWNVLLSTSCSPGWPLPAWPHVSFDVFFLSSLNGAPQSSLVPLSASITGPWLPTASFSRVSPGKGGAL